MGHSDNGYRGSWEQDSKKLIAEVSGRRHWSEYLNLFALTQDGFVANAASEIWAELFMLWHLQPDCPEARLIDDSMDILGERAELQTIRSFATELGMPRGATGEAASGSA